ncbi:unnamed protein product [Ilex paraguariensis]|uniref:Uncharacterized protein n=1 Tax=Ilex paraguariensis TaxID=185542 RepID=A0ABC8SR31_9AQUA
METKKKRKAGGKTVKALPHKYRPRVNNTCYGGIGQMKNKQVEVGDPSNCPKPPNVVHSSTCPKSVDPSDPKNKNKNVDPSSHLPNLILANQEEWQKEMKEWKKEMKECQQDMESLKKIRKDTKEPLKQLNDDMKESLK